MVTDSAALHGLVAAMLAACPDLHVLRDPTRGGFGHLAQRDRPHRAGRRPAGRAGDPGAAGCRPTPAPCSAWIRSTWPTRASWSRSCPGPRRTRCWRRCGRIRSARARRSSASASPSIRAWWWPGPPSAAPAWSTCRWRAAAAHLLNPPGRMGGKARAPTTDQTWASAAAGTESSSSSRARAGSGLPCAIPMPTRTTASRA